MNEQDKDHLLPGRISSVTPQKRNKDRYSLYIDDEFLIGVSEETLLEFNIRKGLEVTSPMYHKLQRAEGRNKAKSYLMKLLARRDHARRELMTKALRKDYTKETIEDVLYELEKKNFVDDAKFAEKFVEDKMKHNKWGPSKIRSHLIKKGIKKEYIDRAIDRTFGGLDLEETYKNLVLKKKRRFLREQDRFKRKKKVFDYLCRKGYKPGDIMKYIDGLLEILER